MDLEFLARIVGPDPARVPRRVDPVVRRDASVSTPGAEPRASRRESAADGVVVALSAEARSRVDSGDPGGASTGRIGELTEDEQEEVEALRSRDAEVRAHENAHKAAAGQHARGGPRYEYERGPDGRRYAVGGEVKIDTSAVPDDPDATIMKMRQVRRAALAPAEPSPQDRRVAAEASAKETAARAEKQQAKREGETDGPGAIPRRAVRGYGPPSEPRRGGFDVVA